MPAALDAGMSAAVSKRPKNDDKCNHNPVTIIK